MAGTTTCLTTFCLCIVLFYSLTRNLHGWYYVVSYYLLFVYCSVLFFNQKPAWLVLRRVLLPSVCVSFCFILLPETCMAGITTCLTTFCLCIVQFYSLTRNLHGWYYDVSHSRLFVCRLARSLHGWYYDVSNNLLFVYCSVLFFYQKPTWLVLRRVLLPSVCVLFCFILLPES